MGSTDCDGKPTGTGKPVMNRFLENLSKRELEIRAETVLQKVWGGIIKDGPIDVEGILEMEFNLRLFIGRPEDIGQTEGVLGAIFFEQREVFVNEALLGAPGRYRFTLAHELGHWVLHQDVVDPIEYAWPFVPGKQHRGRRILCRAGESSPLERQANIFAAALLMPRWTFSNKVHAIAEDMGLVRSSSGYVAHEEGFARLIESLSSMFAVSRESAKYRLVELSLVSIGDHAQEHFVL